MLGGSRHMEQRGFHTRAQRTRFDDRAAMVCATRPLPLWRHDRHSRSISVATGGRSSPAAAAAVFLLGRGVLVPAPFCLLGGGGGIRSASVARPLAPTPAPSGTNIIRLQHRGQKAHSPSLSSVAAPIQMASSSVIMGH